MYEAGYTAFTLRQSFAGMATIAGVAIAYPVILRTSGEKRLLAIVPSLLLLSMALGAAILAGATDPAHPQTHPVVEWALLIGLPIAAIGATLFNIFYIRSWLHLMQLVNFAAGFYCWFIAIMAVSHDWL
jgi:hypothetical protein